jgi:hypothetical protein
MDSSMALQMTFEDVDTVIPYKIQKSKPKTERRRGRQSEMTGQWKEGVVQVYH